MKRTKTVLGRKASGAPAVEHGKPANASAVGANEARHHIAVVAACKAVLAGQGTLSGAVKAAVKDGVPRKAIEAWAVEAGFSPAGARSTISRALVADGQRQRKPGAGPSTPKQAKELGAYAVTQYGDAARKLLLAAYRWLGKAKAKKA